MKKFVGIILSLVLSISLAACNTQPRMGAGNLVIATSTDGELELLLRDYLYFLGNIRAEYEEWLVEQMGLSLEELSEYWEQEVIEGSGQTIFEEIKDVALEQAKWTVALYNIVRARGYTYEQVEMNLIRERIQEAVMFFASPEITGERAFYEVYYVTPDEIIEVFRMISTINSFQRSIHDNIVVADADIRAFYDDPENYDLIESLRGVTVAHILVTFDREASDTEADREETFALAEGILARIEAGESFASLVEQYSQDTASIPAEGQYYITRHAPFVPEFMEWTFAAEEGDLGIVETSHGLHIMNLVRRDSFEDLLFTRALIVEDTTLPSLEDIIRHDLFIAEMESIIEEEGIELISWTVNEELFNSIQYDVYARQRR